MASPYLRRPNAWTQHWQRFADTTLRAEVIWIAEAALQDFVIFAERMELADDRGRPSALAAIEAGGPIWRLPGNIPVIM